MCGIVGFVGRSGGKSAGTSANAVPVLLEGLRRLEYRGYDSAGIVLVGARAGADLKLIKCAGKVADLAAIVPPRARARVGIAHTRWATHGAPTDTNAHPHLDHGGKIAVVHNGIIENATALKQQLARADVAMRSETDSEVLPNLIAQGKASGLDLLEATRAALALCKGTWGIAVVDADEPDRIVVACNGSPVVLGIGENAIYVASDPGAIVRYTRQMVTLDDGELAELTADGFSTSTLDAVATAKTPAAVDVESVDFDKGGYAHFMRKEMAEQPETLARTLQGRLDARFQTARLAGIEMDARALLQVRRIKILGCGSALIAGQVGAHCIEQLARIPADAESAAEFRYRNPVIEQDTLYIAVSQSGETFDTLAAVQEIQRKGGELFGVVNVVGSSIARTCGRGIYLHSGPEISVVSTKTFTSTLAAFVMVALHLGRIRDLSISAGAQLVAGLTALPDQITQVLAQEADIRVAAERLSQYNRAYFIGRRAGFGIATEGALKLKEVSYLHAESYPASELKHGPLALIDEQTPTIVVLPDDDLFEKNISSIEEIKARGGPVFTISHRTMLPIDVDVNIAVPKSEDALDPILINVALQLLAYHTGVARGCDVDQPRNLAKSVTVE